MKTAVVALLMIVASVAGCREASAQQWPASALALRTNGGALKAGECVRLALVATDDVTVPFQPVVRYAFSQAVTIEDEDKNTRNETRRVSVDRPPSAVIEPIGAGATVVLDAVGAAGGLNRLLVLRGERLLRVVQDGLAPTGPAELSIAGSAFAGLGPAPVDLVLHDQVGHRSATLARLVIGR